MKFQGFERKIKTIILGLGSLITSLGAKSYCDSTKYQLRTCHL